MKRSLSLAILLLPIGIGPVAVAQTPKLIHDAWTSAAPMPRAIWFPGAVAVLEDKIYVAGGETGDFGTTPVDTTQVYDPATNTWSVAESLPTPLLAASSAVVNGIWYVMGGSTDEGITISNATWAYDPKRRDWIARAPMPIALFDAGTAVYNGTIYVVGGSSEAMFRASTVESFNPATNTWTLEASLLTAKSEPSVALFRTMIVAADGATSANFPYNNGDNEGYDVLTNRWVALAPDPIPRNQACSGGIGSKLYVAGGSYSSLESAPSNESYDLLTNTWRTLADMPQPSQYPASAVYLGRLYCIGGAGSFPAGPVYNYVQIYHP